LQLRGQGVQRDADDRGVEDDSESADDEHARDLDHVRVDGDFRWASAHDILN